MHIGPIKRAQLVLMVVLAVGVAACGSAASPGAGGGTSKIADAAKTHTFSWGTFKLAQRIIDKAASGQPLNVVVNNQGVAIPVFGAEQKIGTDRGCAANQAKLKIACRLTGPASTDATAQLAELETLLSSGQVDCLGIESPTPDAFVDIINKYVAAGVPVYTQNTDVPNSNRFAFFALNERASGNADGVATANLVKAKGYTIDTIGMGSGGPEAPWAQDRMGGFEAGYKTVFPDAKFAQEEKTGLPTGKDYTTEEVVSSVGPYLTGNPNVNLFFHTDQGVEGVGLVIKDKNLSGKVWTSGFNVTLQILDLMDAGIILVTINQGFDNQAEAAVNACVNYLTTGDTPADPLAYLQPIIITKDGGTGQQTSADARTHLKQVLGP
jgi:ABC-type sugar transport system substrate-binding protein